ncbi:MAG: NUDIX domain-containing protein [Anaerolineae bacterium]|nr:NUDIX domain-containing protein [Anaerolineae bacterium]
MGATGQGAEATAGRWLTIPRTLCFVQHGEELLLMKRAAHKRVFPNQYNGLGGHIERDEDPYSSARREILEESGLAVQQLRLRAVYNIDAGQATGIILFVFTARSATRAYHSDTTEGTLHWVSPAELATLDLVEDLPLILPRILHLPDDAPPLFVHASYDASDTLCLRFAGND